MKKALLTLIGVALLIAPFWEWLGSLRSGLPLSSYLYDVGRLFALLGFVRLFIQVGLSARIKLLERDIGLDKLLEVHRISALSVIGLLMLHPVLLLASESLAGYSTPFGPVKLLGAIGLLVLVGTGLVGFFGERLKWHYETWTALHRLGFLLFPVGFVHSFFFGTGLKSPTLKGLWIVLACLYTGILVHRALMKGLVRRHPLKVVDVTRETHDVQTVFLEGRPIPFRPGQFMFVNFDEKGKRSHPFTVSSSPTQDRLSITVKAVGDFTASLQDLKPGDLAFVDAPYGEFSFTRLANRPLVFIAGGIGITPFLSMLRYMMDKKLKQPVTLLWANKTQADIIAREELEKMASEMPDLKVVHVLSREKEWEGETGHIDERVIRRHVDDLGGSLFLLCGPPAMMVAVRKVLKGLKVPRSRTTWERFSLR